MKSFAEATNLRIRILCFPPWPCVIAWVFLATLTAASRTHAGPLQWNSEVVDSQDTVGWYSSVALDSMGKPHIAYYDSSSEAVQYASWDGTMWDIETVTSAGRRQGGSWAIDSNDVPHISMRDYDNGKLMYAIKNGSSWDVEEVATIGAPGVARTFIAVDADGNPGIVAHGAAGVNPGLHYSKKIGGSWQTKLVASNGSHAALVYDAGRNPHISFHDSESFERNLKYATLNGSIWDIQTVDDDGWTGWYTSIVLDSDDLPHISYLDRANLDLEYASWNGSSWDIQTVDSQNETGFYSSLAFDSSWRPSIAYLDGTLDELRYAAWDGSSWVIQTVDSEGDVGSHSSLAIDDHGFAHISYYDDDNRDLKYAIGVPEPGTLVMFCLGMIAVIVPRTRLRLTRSPTARQQMMGRPGA